MLIDITDAAALPADRTLLDNFEIRVKIAAFLLADFPWSGVIITIFS